MDGDFQRDSHCPSHAHPHRVVATRHFFELIPFFRPKEQNNWTFVSANYFAQNGWTQAGGGSYLRLTLARNATSALWLFWGAAALAKDNGTNVSSACVRTCVFFGGGLMAFRTDGFAGKRIHVNARSLLARNNALYAIHRRS